VPLQLHFALFGGGAGFVLKPSEMCTSLTEALDSKNDFWPPPRDSLHRATIQVISLHNLPKRHERRPRHDGRRSECHNFVPELSGEAKPPDNQEPSSPALTLTMHPIGGFCALDTRLPLRQEAEMQLIIPAVMKNGLNAPFNRLVHCVAAEPRATFLRIAVTSGMQEVAYEVGVLARLRCGYRVFQLRSLLGTRIELAYLLVRIETGSEPNHWASWRQQALQLQKFRKSMEEQQERIEAQGQRLENLHAEGATHT